MVFPFFLSPTNWAIQLRHSVLLVWQQRSRPPGLLEQSPSTTCKQVVLQCPCKNKRKSDAGFRWSGLKTSSNPFSRSDPDRNSFFDVLLAFRSDICSIDRSRCLPLHTTMNQNTCRGDYLSFQIAGLKKRHWVPKRLYRWKEKCLLFDPWPNVDFFQKRSEHQHVHPKMVGTSKTQSFAVRKLKFVRLWNIPKRI